jgi:unsaturated rhamnogalacturonyl hydrolase
MRNEAVVRGWRVVVVAAWLGACGGGGGGAAGGAGGSGGGAGTATAGGAGAGGAAGMTGAAGDGGAAGATGGAGTAGVGGAGGGAGSSVAGTGGGAGAAGSGGGAGSGAGTGGGAGAAGGGGRGGASAGSGGGGGSSGGGAGRGGAGGAAGGAGRGGAGGGAGSGAMLPSNSLAVRLANAVLSRWPDPLNITTPAGWEYNHGIVLRGIEQVWRRTGDARYLTYIQRYNDQYVSANGTVTLLDPANHSFDNLQPAIFLPVLYEQTGMAKYKTAADSIRARYDTIPRNAERGFWHKQTYPNQMWLDSIYMGEPFLMRYATMIGGCGTFCSDTVFEQMLLLSQHVRDTSTGLLYHAWDGSATNKASWANATTGRSPSVWGRALGWYAMALVDVLPDLPAGAQRDQMLAILQGLATGLKNNQDATTGLWYQVVDQGSRSDNWLESSGSGMFVYTLKVAVDRGYIDASYLAVAQKGWQGMMSKVTTDGGGTPSITGAVKGMGVQNNYAGYVATSLMPLLTNSSHGLCSILLAASEMEAQ